MPRPLSQNKQGHLYNLPSTFFAGFEVCTALILKFPAFWYVTTYRLTASYQLFCEIGSLQLQEIPEGANLQPFFVVTGLYGRRMINSRLKPFNSKTRTIYANFYEVTSNYISSYFLAVQFSLYPLSLFTIMQHAIYSLHCYETQNLDQYPQGGL